MALSEVGLDDIDEANKDLTKWLIKYNSYRPHQALDYKTPLEYAQETFFEVLGGFELSTGVYVNTQEPDKTISFIKEHFGSPDWEKIRKEHRAEYERRV